MDYHVVGKKADTYQINTPDPNNARKQPDLFSLRVAHGIEGIG
jgi:hypothetical protein